MRQFLANLVASSTQLESITATDLERVNQILEQYADSQLDFVDAVIVTIAERAGITHVLTLDRRDFSLRTLENCKYFSYQMAFASGLMDYMKIQ